MRPPRTALALILAVACCAPATALAANTFSIGTSGADTIDGGSGADVIFGLAGADTIGGGGGNDRIDGDGSCPATATGPGECTNTRLGAGDDRIDGQAGDDVIT